jgi:alcohol dehydrogenase
MIENSMQQFTFVAANKFEWREVDAPKIVNSGQAIVKPLVVARCDLDLYIANGTVPMKDSPFAFGHEIAGEVVEVGDSVTIAKVGDKVIVPFQINCGDCDNCKQGFTNACSSVPAFSAYGLAQSSGQDWGGGLSDYILVPFADAMLVKIPQEVSLSAAAAISDNASDGYRTVAGPLADRPGTEVLIVGGYAQSVGLYTAQAAIAEGAQRVVYQDFDDGRLLQAKQLGAEPQKKDYSSARFPQEQFPIVVDASNLREGLIHALRSTVACGVCTSVSAPSKTIDGIPLTEMYMKGINFNISRVHARAEIETVLDCARCGSIAHNDVISRAISFEDAADVITDPDVKIVFVREEQ